MDGQTGYEVAADRVSGHVAWSRCITRMRGMEIAVDKNRAQVPVASALNGTAAREPPESVSWCITRLQTEFATRSRLGKAPSRLSSFS